MEYNTGHRVQPVTILTLDYEEIRAIKRSLQASSEASDVTEPEQLTIKSLLADLKYA